MKKIISSRGMTGQATQKASRKPFGDNNKDIAFTKNIIFLERVNK